MRFKVSLNKAEEGGYWVTVPALKGCGSQGETRAEALENIKEAIECHFEAMQSDTKTKKIKQLTSFQYKEQPKMLSVCV